MAGSEIIRVMDSVWGYARTLVIPDLLTWLTITIPIFLAIGITWMYFFAMRRGHRSFSGAIRQAFPLSDYRSVSFRSDFCNFWLMQLCIWPLFGVFAKLMATVVSADLVRDLLIRFFGRPASLIHIPGLIIAVQATVLILADDFAGFVGHYMMHKVPFLWSLHRAHHSAESLTVFTTNRGHPLDFLTGLLISPLITGVIIGICLYLTKTPADSVALTILGYYFSLQGIRVILQHSRIRLSFGWLNHIFVAPVLHQIHHSAELRHRDKNLGLNFALWDWIFGTLYLPDKNETWRFGLNDEELGIKNPHARVWDYYVEPVRHMFAKLN